MDYRDPDWVGEKLGIDRNTVYRFLQDGTIPALQLGRKWLVSERHLAEWLEHETQRQTAARRESLNAGLTERRRLHYTASARQALKRAHSEARRYGHAQLDSAHLLLGLVTQSESPVAPAMAELGITPQQVRAPLEQELTPSDHPVARRLPRTADAKRAMRLAGKIAARRAGAGGPLNPVGTDHLLRGILLARHGLGSRILTQRGVTRRALMQALRHAAGSEAGLIPQERSVS